MRTPSPEAELAKYKVSTSTKTLVFSFDFHLDRLIISLVPVCVLQALPPIKQISIDRQRKKQREMAKLDEKFWERPEPPKAFLLHLGVTSRTHNVADYQRNFDEQYKNYYIDRYNPIAINLGI